MPPQIGHKKSRRGCKRCKERRVKCDEARPCRNCVRRNEECSLTFTATADDEESLARFGSSANPIDEEILTRGRGWNKDLFLMHHFTSATCNQLYRKPEVLYIWQIWGPQQTVDHDYLAHGILTLASLHLAYLKPQEAGDYINLSNHHLSRTVASFRAGLQQMGDHNCSQLFAVASLMSVCCLVVFSFKTPNSPLFEEASIDDIVELFVMFRGVRDVLIEKLDIVRAGPCGPLLQEGSIPETTTPLPLEISKLFDGMEKMIYDTCPVGTSRTVSKDALDRLEKVYRGVFEAAPAGGSCSFIWTWLVAVSSEFVTMIQNGHPVALIIVAYFGALTGALRQKFLFSWYLETTHANLLRAVKKSLAADWHGWLEWPEEQIRNGYDTFPMPLANRKADG